MTAEPKQTVFVVDDDPAIRDSLAMLLQANAFHTRTFAGPEEFLADFSPQTRGCVLLDVRMPGMSGIDLQRRLKQDGATIPVILISAHADVPTAVQAMKEGAFSFIEKPFKDEDLLAQVQTCMMEDTEQAQLLEARARLAHLTRRESEVLELLVEGHPSKVIADRLGISGRTVDIHRANLYKKTGARSLAQLIRLALAVRDADASN